MSVVTIENNIMRGAPITLPTTSIAESVIQALRQHGNAVLMVDSATGKEVRANELLQDVATVTEALRKHNIGVGSTVGFCSENRLEYPAAILATLTLGATCAPLNPLYTQDELKHTMNISEPNAVFCSPFTATKIIELKPELPSLRTIIVFGEVASDEDIIAYNDWLEKPANVLDLKTTKIDLRENVAVVLCSSGTTGLPKGVELSHFNIMALQTVLIDPRVTKISDDEVMLGLIPFFHGYGFALLILSLTVKTKIIVMSMFDETLFLESLQNYKVTALFSVPPLMVFLAKHPLVSQYDLSSIRRIRCGAAPLSREIALAVQKRLNISDIKQGYGMTELSIVSTVLPEGKYKMGSSGLVAFGMEGKVVDLETGVTLAPYKEGELCFRGPLIMKGYRKNPKATQEMMDKDGWLHTGDIAFYDVEGFVFIVDRVKELIKYKGFQVAPAELEDLLLKNPAIKDAAVIGIPDDDAGELPFAFIVLQPDAKLSARDVQQFVADKVSAQKRLSGGVRFIDEIPKNQSGKILRRQLRDLYKQTQSKL